MSNLNRWNYIYAGAKKSADFIRTYGNDDVTYKKGYEWLQHCNTIEDWGCGFAFFSKLCKPKQYRGIDGSNTPFADEQVDFAVYKSNKYPGIFMRHVIEHNEDWAVVLRNALESFQYRMCLVLFTPWAEKTYDYEPPERGSEHRCFFFNRQDILDVITSIPGISWQSEENIQTCTQFGVEHVFYLEK
jgi:hypothetical protein